MTDYGHVSLDSVAHLLTSEQTLGVYMLSEPDEPSPETRLQIRDYLDQIPVVEADCVDLYFLRGFTQTRIARILGLTQPTVCYRIHRGMERIRWLASVRDIDTGEWRATMAACGFRPWVIDCCLLYYETSCQSHAAARLGCGQPKIRHTLVAAIPRMLRIPATHRYGDVLQDMMSRPNIKNTTKRKDVQWRVEG